MRIILYVQVTFVLFSVFIEINSFGVSYETPVCTWGPVVSNEWFSDSSVMDENSRYPLHLRILRTPLRFHNELFTGLTESVQFGLNPHWFTKINETIEVNGDGECELNSCEPEDLNDLFSCSCHSVNSSIVYSRTSYGYFMYYDDESSSLYSVEFPDNVFGHDVNSSFLFTKFKSHKSGGREVLYEAETHLQTNSPYGTIELYDYLTRECNPVDMIKVNQSVFLGMTGECNPDEDFLEYTKENSPYTRVIGFEDSVVLDIHPDNASIPFEMLTGLDNITTYYDEFFHIWLKEMLMWKSSEDGMERLVMVGNNGKVIITDENLNILNTLQLNLYSGYDHIVRSTVFEDSLYVCYSSSALKPVFISVNLITEEQIREEISTSMTPLKMIVLEEKYLFAIGRELILQFDIDTLELLVELSLELEDLYYGRYHEEKPYEMYDEIFFSAVPPEIYLYEDDGYKVYEFHVLRSYWNPREGGILTFVSRWKISLCSAGLKKGTVNFGVCEPCEENSYTLAAGQPKCNQGCPFGSFPNSNFTACLPCPKGTYSDSVILNVEGCIPCGKGTYSDVEGIGSTGDCKPCPAGTKGVSSGLTSSSQCQACDGGVESCPLGSSIEFESYFLSDEEVVYSETVNELVDNLWNIVIKVVILASVVVIGALVVSCYCCLATFKICPHSCFDLFYSMAHDINEGESPVKRSSYCGGLCSLVALSTALCLILWSVFDFSMQNTDTSESTTLGISSNEEESQSSLSIEEWTFGKYTSQITIFGDFSSCEEEDFTSSFYSDGFSESGTTLCKDYSSSSTSSDEFYYSSMKGCTCVWECEDCMITKSQLTIYLNANTGGQYIRSIQYESTFPHYKGDEQYRVNGNIVETGETLEYVQTQFSLFRTLKVTYSYLNLLSQMVDYTYSPESHGVLASVLTNDKETNPSPQSTIEVEMVYSLSVFHYEIIENQKQSLLSFLAQISALISLSITIVGIFFGCFGKCDPWYFFTRKKRKEEEMKKKFADVILKSESFTTFLKDNQIISDDGKKGKGNDDEEEGNNDDEKYEKGGGKEEDEDEDEGEEGKQEYFEGIEKDEVSRYMQNKSSSSSSSSEEEEEDSVNTIEQHQEKEDDDDDDEKEEEKNDGDIRSSFDIVDTSKSAREVEFVKYDV